LLGECLPPHGSASWHLTSPSKAATTAAEMQFAGGLMEVVVAAGAKG